MLDRIDTERLRRDLASAGDEGPALKRVLRRAWTRPTADEQRRLARLARRATELCVLLARARGRWHVTEPPRELRRAGAAWDRDACNARVADRAALDDAPPAEAREGAAP
ncbi:MAG TPA: hypothetical protein VFS43_42540 [Polyangiaceae bacterium]|nr:hypothetical protein [Polyangiaceae bacterium]